MGGISKDISRALGTVVRVYFLNIPNCQRPMCGKAWG